MKPRTVVLLVVGLVVVCSIATKALSDDTSDNTDLTKEAQRLRAEVKTLRRQVDTLKIVLGYDENDIDTLTQRVEEAENLMRFVEPLFRAEIPPREGTQLHQCFAALQHAQARLAFAKKDYDAAIEHMDAAISGWKKVQEILENRREVGSVTLSLLIDAQKSATDARLEKNRMRRTIQFLHSEKPGDVTGSESDE